MGRFAQHGHKEGVEWALSKGASTTGKMTWTIPTGAKLGGEGVPGWNALHWLAKGFGYEVTGSDVWTAFSSTVAAAERTGRAPEVRARIRQIISDEDAGGFVNRVLGREFGM